MSQTFNIDEIILGTTPPATDVVKLVDSMNALKTHFSGNPANITTPFAEQLILDTSVTPNVLRKRNAANSAWGGLPVAEAVSGEQAARLDQLSDAPVGLTMSTAGGSNTMGISAGYARDSTGTLMLRLASAFTKTTSAWAVGTGNGSLMDAGSVLANGWEHFYLIRRPDTGVVDIGSSALYPDPSAVLPANYTQYRYIGSGLTVASLWRKFYQYFDYFEWDVPATDYNTSTLSTSLVPITLPTPLGVVTEADLIGYATHATGTAAAKILNPAITDTNAAGGGDVTVMISANNAYCNYATKVFTDTSSRVSAVASYSSFSLLVTCKGYTNPRGRNA
jgi:hypothetical protein